MGNNLVIVESPAKAKTIKKYLGKDFEVLASYGHVRDLVPKEGAVDPKHNFAMKYQPVERNRKHVDAIARALKDNGVGTIFGLIGDANLYMVDAFIREQQGEYVSAANEAGAVIMALGYASVTGKVGVALTASAATVAVSRTRTARTARV